MLAKAFDLPSYLIWSPLTFLIRSYILENSASMDELFLISWIFSSGGSRHWVREWICDIGAYCASEWFERLENVHGGANGIAPRFSNGFFQAEEMVIRSLGEKPLNMEVKRSDGKVFETFIPGDSALEFKSALKSADQEIGPILDLMTDGHTSYPQANEWLEIIHYSVNRSEKRVRRRTRIPRKRSRKPMVPRERMDRSRERIQLNENAATGGKNTSSLPQSDQTITTPSGYS